MAYVKWHYQHHHYLLFLLTPDWGAIRPANLKGDKTTWDQWYKKEKSSKASPVHLNNEGLRLCLLNDSIFPTRSQFKFVVVSSWLKRRGFESNGHSDWAIMGSWTLTLILHDAQFSDLWNGYNSESVFHLMMVSWDESQIIKYKSV